MWEKSRPELHFSSQFTSTVRSVGLCEKQVQCLLSIQPRHSEWLFQISTVVLHRNIYLIIHLLTHVLKDLAQLQ